MVYVLSCLSLNFFSPSILKMCCRPTKSRFLLVLRTILLKSYILKPDIIIYKASSLLLLPSTDLQSLVWLTQLINRCTFSWFHYCLQSFLYISLCRPWSLGCLSIHTCRTWMGGFSFAIIFDYQPFKANCLLSFFDVWYNFMCYYIYSCSVYVNVRFCPSSSSKSTNESKVYGFVLSYQNCWHSL